MKTAGRKPKPRSRIAPRPSTLCRLTSCDFLSGFSGWSRRFLCRQLRKQLREAIPSDHSYRFLIYDRDAIFSAEVDQQLKAFGLRVLHTPARAPKANAYCERLVGSVRRECLDFMIPLDEKHLRRILSEWVTHYNRGRPHLSLGPGIPERAAVFPPLQDHDKHSFH